MKFLKTVKRGKKKLDYDEVTPSSKRRKKINEYQRIPSDMVPYIIKKKLRDEGNTERAQLIDKIVNQTEALNIQELITQPKCRKMTPDEALSMCIEAGLSKNGYEIIRNMAIRCGYDLFPCYVEVKIYVNVYLFVITCPVSEAFKFTFWNI